jgi:DNA-binding NarL/FixJ family response regulator
MIPSSAPISLRADGNHAPKDLLRRLSVPREATRSPAQVTRVKVRIVHEVPLIASGIRAVLARSGEFELVAEEGPGGTEILIADVASGLRALRGGAGRNVLIITDDDGEAVIRTALEQGARGFLLHTCGVDELTGAARALGRGGTAFAPLVASRIAASIASEPLTDREREVLQLLVQGSADKEVARRLASATGTVKTHVRSILTKLGAARRAEAVAIAQRRGLARLDPIPIDCSKEMP